MTRYKRTLSNILTVAAVASVVFCGLTAQGATAAGAPKPAGKPAVMGMIHVNAPELYKELPALINQFQAFMPPEFGKQIPAIMKTLEKIDGIDIFILTAGRQPMPVAAFSGKFGPQDIADLMPIFAGMKTAPKKLSEGRYSIGPIQTITHGKRMFAAPNGMLSPEMLAMITKSEKKLLAGLLAKVDRKAHIWGGFEGMNKMDKEAPASAAGGISIGKNLSGKVDMIFADEKYAEQTEQGISKDSGEMFGKMLKVARDGKSVTVKLNGSPAQLLVSLARARAIAKRAIAKTRLKGLGTSMELYASDHKDQYPPTLAKLVEAKLATPKMLLSPSSGRTTIKTDENGVPTEPGDFTYIVLPANAPGGLVVLYEDPKINDGEGANVLYRAGNVAWVTPEKLKEDLAKTNKWLADNSK